VKPKYIGLLLFLCCLAGAASASADYVVQITGSFTCAFSTPSGPVCGPFPPQSDLFGSFSVSFELDETTIKFVPDSMSVTTTGNLGTFVAAPIISPLQFGWYNQFGNGIQLDFSNELDFGATVPDPALGIHPTVEFWFDGYPFSSPSPFASVSVEPVATPEPSTILCLLAGFAVALIAGGLRSLKQKDLRSSLEEPSTNT